MNFKSSTKIITMIIVIFILLSPIGILTQTLEEYRSKLDKIKERIFEERSKRMEMAQKELSIIGEIQSLEKEISATQKNIDIVDKELKVVREEVKSLETEIDRLQAELVKNQDDLGLRLVSLYKMGKFRELRILSKASDYSDFLRRIKFLIIIADADRKLAEEIKEDKERMEKVLEQLEIYREEVEGYHKLYTSEKVKLEQDRKELDSVLSEVRGKKDSYERMISELKSQSSELEAMIRKMTRKVEGEEEVIFSPPSKNYIKGSTVIAPTRGQIVRPFGKIVHPVYGTVTRNEGIDISAPLYQEVSTVMSGKVIFSDWFKGYGKIVIVDHGDGVTTLYAHLNDIYVSTGETISEGDIIGTVGNTGTLGDPLLHFEIRTNGNAIDPAAWISENYK